MIYLRYKNIFNIKKVPILSIFYPPPKIRQKKTAEDFSPTPPPLAISEFKKDSFVQFPLEKNSRKVYNYSTKFMVQIPIFLI